jgi:hypothetical protein
MRSTPDDSQIRLFDFDELKPRIELGQSFERIDDAIKQGLIPPYDCKDPNGIPFWMLATASEFEKDADGKPLRGKKYCGDCYAKAELTIAIDPDQLPVELKPLAGYRHVRFLRSIRSVDPDAIIVGIGRGPGSLRESMKIPQAQSVRRLLTAKALIEYLGVGKHLLFDELHQKSGLKIQIDERILRACALPITATDLRSETRGNGDEERSLYPDRVKHLVQQGKLYTWREGRLSYYWVKPPREPEPALSAAEVKVVEDRPQAMLADSSELAWESLDRKILKSAASPITAKGLYEKARHSKLGEKHFQPRRDYLVAQGKLHTWTEQSRHGRPITYYWVNPPIQPEPAPDVAEAEMVDPVGSDNRPVAIVPAANTLASPDTVQDLLLDQQDHRFLERFKNPDERWFLAICTSAAQKIGRPIEWVDFGGRLWLTVKQSANLLGMDERNIRKHLDQFPFEMSVLSEKLMDARLDAYKQCYPPNPPELRNSEFRSSGGLGGQNEKAAHEFSPHFVLVSPAGLAWLAKASETRPAKAIMQEFWMVGEATPAAMERMSAQAGSALVPQDRVLVELLVELRDGNRELREGHREMISLLKTMAPVATRTEEGIVRVEEKVSRIDRNTNSPRREFLPEAISGAIKAFLHITLKTGRDVLDQTLLIDVNGFKTKDCEFDHIRSRSDRSAQNCMPLSKATHDKKTYGRLTPEEKAKLERAEKAIENYWAQKSQIEPYQPGLSLDTQL